MSKQVKSFSSLPRNTDVFFFVGIPVVFVATFLYPISQSGLSGDDIPNSMRSAALQANNWTRWKFITHAIKHWKTSEGRFFPMSTIENVFMFDFIHSVAIFKFLQLSVTIILLVLAAVVIAKLVDSKKLFPLAMFLLLSCLQTRNWYDPTLGFGLLLQSVQIKFLACLYLLNCFLKAKERKWLWSLGCSTALWHVALLQYEVVVTLFPTLVIMIIFLPSARWRKLTAFATLGVPTMVYLLYVSRLRAGVSATAAYSINSDFSEVALTYLKQISGGLPFSASIWSRGAMPLLSTISDFPLPLLFIVTSMVCLTVFYRSEIAGLKTHHMIIVFAIGLNLVFGPPLTTALSLRWQNEVQWGLSYLSVAFTYTGVAFVALSILFVFSKLCMNRPKVFTAVFTLFLVFFTLSAVSNQALLSSNVTATQDSREQRDLYELAIRQDFFSMVPDRSVVVYPSYDENSWVNTYFTEWLGGPKELVFVKAAEDAQGRCTTNVLFEKCPRIFHLNYLSSSYTSFVLSLVELDAQPLDSQLIRSFFGNLLHAEELKPLCYGPIKQDTTNSMVYSCDKR